MTTHHVLLVDDNPGDARLLTEALGDVAQEIVVHSVDSAAAAFSFLARAGSSPSQPTPDLLVLDINMPMMNGLDALTHIKGQAPWRSIPVAVLSSTHNQEERDQAVQLGAAAFFPKPNVWPKYVELAQSLRTCLEGPARTSDCLKREAPKSL